MKDLIHFVFSFIATLIGFYAGAYYICKKNNKTLNSLIEESAIRQEEFNELKVTIMNDDYVKQESLAVLKFYKDRIYHRTGNWSNLNQSWDEFYNEYQESKIK